jgi:hypothetical protein
MEASKTVKKTIKDLGFNYEATPGQEPGTEVYDILVDEAENIEVNGLLYETEDGAFFRLMSYVDEINKDKPLEQLSLLMALNLDIPTGAYCLDPEDDVILATVNIPLAELTAELLGWVIEFLIVAQEVYFQEFYPVDPEKMPQS